jgi:uncharacterized repeat protein (TIGR01451 family)
MNFKFYPLRALLLSLLLFGFKAQMQAQDLLFAKRVENVTAQTDGTSAVVNDELVYYIDITNLTSQNFVASRLYDNIPAGVSYIANSTKMNGSAYADVSGRMPFAASGNYVRSPGGYAVGLLAPGQKCTVEFHVKVTANGGSIFNNATIDATQNGASLIQATNTVFTNLDPTAAAACNVIYQVSPLNDASGTPHSYIRTVSTTNGQGSAILYNGRSSPQKEAWSGTDIDHYVNQWWGEDLLSGCAAIAYDHVKNRIYFVNNYGGAPLCYIDLNGATKTAYRFTDSILEKNTANGYNVNRMGFGSDGVCYALTSNAQDFIKFTVNAANKPIITRMGPLTDAATNDTNSVLAASTSGGDLFADGSGKLYLIGNNSKMFKINPTTKVATYMGKVNPFPGTSQSLAINAAGDVFINGAYHDVHKLNLGTMASSAINGANHANVFQSGDYTSWGYPVLASSIIADKSYKNKNGGTVVNGGDTVIYTITVTNIGNLNAAGVYMYDYIPPSTIYLPGTTKLNNIAVADVGGVMPFAVSGGKLVNTLGETGGIIRPGASNAAVVTFMVVTEPNKEVCNQSKITLLDADGNVMFVNSSDPTNVGQTPTCFYSDGVLPLNNLKFKGTLNDNKSVLSWSMAGDESVAYYQVEYSDNGTSFYTAGKVAGLGQQNATTNNYQYVDADHTFAPVRCIKKAEALITQVSSGSTPTTCLLKLHPIRSIAILTFRSS